MWQVGGVVGSIVKLEFLTNLKCCATIRKSLA